MNKASIQIKLALVVFCSVQFVFSCKNSLTTKASKLRDTTKVTVGAQIQMVDSILKVKPNDTTTVIKNVRGSFVRSENNTVDLTKMSGGQVVLANIKTLKVTATISVNKSKEMTCLAENVALNPAVAAIDFICDGDGTNPNPSPTPTGSVNIKKYPPNVMDESIKETYDLLAVQCLKTTGNVLVSDEADRDVIYGCYCPKTDHQLMFDSLLENPVESFEYQCNTVQNNAPLLSELQKACIDENQNVQQTSSSSCTCIGNGITTTLNYVEFHSIYKPTIALKQRRIKQCGH